MITNLPTRESLNNVALRIYFRAWSDLLDVWTDFALMFEQTFDVGTAVKDWPTEWEDYLVAAQTDLQSISSLLQQSVELALKARVCAVSPYLLLLDSAMNLSASPKSIDFSELRTLDAVDLPGAVNTLTDQPVSDEFITAYTQLRSRRNKITHLGEAGVTMTPDELMRLAVSLYVAVWPGRQWLADRLDFADPRAAWLHDGKYTSTHMVVLHEWPAVVSLLKKGEFKALFGQEKSRRRYLCHDCVYEGDTRYAGLEKPGCGTAYLDESGTVLTCVMCGQTSKVERRKCTSCPGDVIADNGDDWVGHCHTCGEELNA
ncbi:hypothetical protein [Chenggangzhangella methanolivorans]|uniref:Uncharacterized protein n=1 Tax=Chenggangzhangella methanolivorans TaxID=1437009 RepID=A0A9E6R8X0_9HYPH|nr:hypothetical protein [Chenggangzhangella methanolivorans]QZO00371.1 hypothetical protein K6K41_00880 [Chenggangzhangella methanolivorans]